jgi:hypothetical protein
MQVAPHSQPKFTSKMNKLYEYFLGTLLAYIEINCSCNKLIRPEVAALRMDRKEIIKMCMECPLYFTMPVHLRLRFVKKREQAYSANGLREALLCWVKTGKFLSPP